MEYSELPSLPSAQSSQETSAQWQVPTSCMQQQNPMPGNGITTSDRPTFPSTDLQRFGNQSEYQVPASSRDPNKFGKDLSSHTPLFSRPYPKLNCSQSSAFELISSANSDGDRSESSKSTPMDYRMHIDEGAVKSTNTKQLLHMPLKIKTEQSKPFSDDQSLALEKDVTCNKEPDQPVTSPFSDTSPSKQTASDIGQNELGISLATTSTKIADDFNMHDENRQQSPNGEDESKSYSSGESSPDTKETSNNGDLKGSSSSLEKDTQITVESPVTDDKKETLDYNLPSEKPSRSKIESSSNLQDDTNSSFIRKDKGSSETTIVDEEPNMKEAKKSFQCYSLGNENNHFEIPPLPPIKMGPFRRGPFKAASATKEPVQTPKQPPEVAKESSLTNLLPFVKQEPKESQTSGSKITEIINLCEKHVFGQTSSIQIILNICSEATGFPGCERFCSQIITVCNQILSETYENSHSIIDLCKNLTVTGGKKRGTGCKKSANTHNQTAYAEPDFEDDLSDLDEKEDTKDEDFDWQDILQNSDSEDGLNQEDDPDWSAYWEKKQETRSRRSDTKHKETNTKESKVKETKPKRVRITVPKIEGAAYEHEVIEGSKETNETKDESAFEELLSEEELFEPKKKKKRSKGKKNKTEPKPKPMSPNIKGEFKCTECSKVFLTLRGYQRHENHHRNGFRITCEVCGVACPSPSHYKSHMRTHTGEKPYVCEVCGNSYAQMSTLKGHMLLHSDERPAQCEYCEYNCKSEKRLRRHMIVHTTDKKFQCEDCGARFLRSASLKKHLQIHKDVWPFSCDLCPKKFKSKVHLRRHEEVHRDEYKYQCPVCGKRIRQAGNLKTHMRTHNGEKPYKCESCGKGFAHNVTRKQHQEQCRGHVEVLIQPPSENDYTKYNPALYMVGLKSLAHLS